MFVVEVVFGDEVIDVVYGDLGLRTGRVGRVFGVVVVVRGSFGL